jgi:hypothetical protein
VPAPADLGLCPGVRPTATPRVGAMIVSFPLFGVQPLFVLLLAGAVLVLLARLRRVRSATGEQADDRGVEVQVLRLPAPRNGHVRAAQEADQHAARYLEQGIAIGRGQR